MALLSLNISSELSLQEQDVFITRLLKQNKSTSTAHLCCAFGNVENCVSGTCGRSSWSWMTSLPPSGLQMIKTHFVDSADQNQKVDSTDSNLPNSLIQRAGKKLKMILVKLGEG